MIVLRGEADGAVGVWKKRKAVGPSEGNMNGEWVRITFFHQPSLHIEFWDTKRAGVDAVAATNATRRISLLHDALWRNQIVISDTQIHFSLVELTSVGCFVYHYNWKCCYRIRNHVLVS